MNRAQSRAHLAAVFRHAGQLLAVGVGVAARAVRAHARRVLAAQRLVAEEALETIAASERALFFKF